MTYTGTLSANRKGIPAAFKSQEGRDEGSYLAMFEEGGKNSIHSWVCNTRAGQFILKETLIKLFYFTFVLLIFKGLYMYV
jgi:hypothetical protein